MTTVLVVDDDPAMVRALSMNLAARGYETTTAATGREALLRSQAGPDLLLLDLGLPDLGGIEVITRLRRTSSVPIIVVSARDGSQEKIAALDAGADDYVTKPIGMEELLARIRAAVRRTPAPDLTIRSGGLRIDPVEKHVWRDDTEIRLTPTEWRILATLTSRPGALVGRRDLLQAVWGPAYENETNYLRVYMGTLRKKLESDPSRPRHLITEPGMGYRFVP